MELGTITSKGQMTIPVGIRKHFGLNSGDKLQFVIEDDHIVMVPAKGSVRSLKGMIPRPKKAISIEEMNAAVESEAAHRMTEL